MPTNKITKKIFVVGCPRSGTTLLQNLLLNISGSFSMPETNFFLLLASNNYIAPRSLPPFGKFEYPKNIGYDLFAKIVGSLKKNADLRIDRETESYLGGKAKSGELEAGCLFEVLVESYAGQESGIMIEKTPIHIFHIKIIKLLFPDSVIVGIIRDPRDVFLSFNKMLSLQNKPVRSVREFARLWNKSAKAILQNCIDHIRYEDLITDSLSEINKIINKYNLEIVSLEKNNHSKIVREKEVWKNNVKSTVLSDNSKKYQNNLKEKEIAEIEKLCGENMEKFGYKKEGAKRSTIFAAKDYFRWNLIKAKILKSILAQSIKEKI